jgi:hypothetical protein
LEVAGQEGGEIAMVGAVQSAMERSPELLLASSSSSNHKNKTLTITTRIGYRSLVEESELDTKTVNGNATTTPTTDHNVLLQRLPGDVVVTEDQQAVSGKSNTNAVVHNVSSDYVIKAIESSPLLELEEFKNTVKLVYLIHNPEVQVLEFLKDHPSASQEDQQAYIQEQWKPALETLQDYASSRNHWISFGVVSNGLGIPKENNHPMYLDANLVIDAAKKYDHFSTVQLPVNLLETHGWSMARKIHAAVPSVDVVAMRPLTCYPDLGTGTGYPFRLVDYSLPRLVPEAAIRNDVDVVNVDDLDKSKMTMQYTNEMTTGIPALYQIALQAAMSHFDAEELLEIKQERDLTMEERETLDGCKLVQSMLHDLDSNLEKVRSFAAHEDELYGRIIPLLYDTFEAMDDRTSDVLQAYFAAYAVAVRYAIAKKTRKVLKKGDEGSSSSSSSSSTSSGVTYPDIPQSMTLQEYSLRHMLADKSLSRIVIGASTLQDFEHQTELMEMIAADEAPLDAIAKANERELQEKESDKN